MAPASQHASSPFKDLPGPAAPMDLTFRPPDMPLPLEDAATIHPNARIDNGLKPRAESNSNPFSGSSPRVTAATIGGLVGGFVVVLSLAIGLFIWFRKKSKRRRESYSQITSMPWDRSPLFMVAPHRNQQHDSYGASTHHSFPEPAMEITHNVPRLLPPPRPRLPPPASRDTVQLRHKSSGIILPPRPELEDSQVVEKDSRHLTLQLNAYGPSPTPTTESKESLRPESTAHVDYTHYHQHARFTLSPAINPRLAHKNIDGLYPDSPTLALTPVQARYGPRNPDQRHLDSPTSTFSNNESTGNHSTKEEEKAIYQTAKQVHINSPTSAHTAALPREFHKSSRYHYPNIPSAPPTPPVPRQVHLSTAYLYVADGSSTLTHSGRALEEKRDKLRKSPPSSPVKYPIAGPHRPQTLMTFSRDDTSSNAMNTGSPAIPRKDIRRTMHISTPIAPSQHARKTTSMQYLQPRAISTVAMEPRITAPAAPGTMPQEVPGMHSRGPNPLAVRPSTVTFESTPLEVLSGATYTGPSFSRPNRRGTRPRTVTFEPKITSPPTVAPVFKAPQKGVNLDHPDPKPLGLRPRTTAFGPTMTTASAVLPHASQPSTADPRRPKSLGTGPTPIIPSQNNFIQELPKLDTAVVNRCPTKYHYPTSPRLTRRSTSNLNNTGTLPPRSRPFPFRSSSLSPNSHLINSSDSNLGNSNGNSNPNNNSTNSNNNLNQSPTSPINAVTADSRDIQDMRSTKYLSSDFAATHRTRRQAQRAMTASPTTMSRYNALDNSFPEETDTGTHGVGETPNNSNTIRASPSRHQSYSPTQVTSTKVSAINRTETETNLQPGAGTAGAASTPTTPGTPGTYGTAVVTSTISYSSSQRRGQHHSIKPPQRLMAPLSRGTNVSPKVELAIGLGSGWI